MNNSSEYDIIIVGAGPAGLAVAAGLDKKIKYLIIEASNEVGGSYSKFDPEMKLVSPKGLSQLPKLRYNFKNNYATVGEYCEYLKSYIAFFKLNVLLNSKVKSISKKENSTFTLVFNRNNSEEAITSKYVVVANGKSSFPKKISPEVFKGSPQVIYAKDWRYQPDKSNKVLVVGSGLTACEIAIAAANNQNSIVTLALKDKLKTLPLTLFGVNLHWPFRLIELLPRYFFPICKRQYKDPVIDTGINHLIKHKKVLIIPHIDVGLEVYDQVVIAIGYEYDLSIFPNFLERWSNHNLATKKNETSLKGLYIIGHPCSGNFDSIFLRGIRRDASRLAKRLNKSL